ncbi:mechanosensitive ion channel family protein [Deferrisoma camini]|uniref:mechanosensitive ion channel family protein n=1 Tax=Deferrisoma camini TaxID=1035120 RepID=UPI00046CF628|nr:mechanosensitive ion channel domain-containing protein [Deferrisoma camini]
MSVDALQEALRSLIPLATTYGIQVIGAVFILLVGKVVAGATDNLTQRALRRAKVDPALVGFVGNLVRYGVLTFAVIAALAKFGIQTTSFITVLGAAGLAVGLALQGSLSNFAAGVLILLFRPFTLGDLVETGGVTGVVQHIGILTTTLTTPDNKRIIVPNSQVMGGTIVNYTANDVRRVDLVASIGYADDMAKAKEVLEAMLTEHPMVLEDPAPMVAVGELADSSVNLVVRPWVKTSEYWDAYFDLTRKIKETLDREGISIPFPQRDVHLYRAG